MAGTYSLKAIDVSITLDVDGAGNQYDFQGFATNVSIAKTGGVDFAQAQVEIYGLSIDTMGKLTTLAFRPLNRRWNLIRISAGEQGRTLSTIFQGAITVAYADLNGSRPVLKIEAKTAAYPILDPTPQVSVNGTQTAEQLVQTFASESGFTFKNEGVQATLSDCVITGDPVTKMRAVASAVGADLILDDDKAVLLPQGAVRTSDGGIPVISSETGMIGYPTFSNTGVQVSTFFRPDLLIASAVRVESIVPNATGVWKITQLTHELSAYNPSSTTWKTSFEGMWLSD